MAPMTVSMMRRGADDASAIGTRDETVRTSSSAPGASATSPVS